MKNPLKYYDNLIIIRGGGDLATGIAVRLFNAGFDIVLLETYKPSFIRRTVCFGEAVYEKTMEVEGVKAVLHSGFTYPDGFISVLIDPKLEVLKEVKPLALVDAIIAKKNLGLNKSFCDIVIALGPGFEASVDCHAVIETMRGHEMGRVFYKGKALEDTGMPGVIQGVGKERVIHAANKGTLRILEDIGSFVNKGDAIAEIDGIPVKATIGGLIRGMIKDSFVVHQGMKIADIDPRFEEFANCFIISDKSRALGGSVLEAVLYLRRKNAGS